MHIVHACVRACVRVCVLEFFDKLLHVHCCLKECIWYFYQSMRFREPNSEKGKMTSSIELLLYLCFLHIEIYKRTFIYSKNLS